MIVLSISALYNANIEAPILACRDDLIGVPITGHYNGYEEVSIYACHDGLLGLSLPAIIIDRYEGPHISLTIALHRGFYLAITMDRYEGPTLPLL
jgi:hypothetical protein